MRLFLGILCWLFSAGVAVYSLGYLLMTGMAHAFMNHARINITDNREFKVLVKYDKDNQ